MIAVLTFYKASNKITLLSWHHKIIWKQVWGLLQRFPVYNHATLMRGFNFIYRVHTYLSPLCYHVILYPAQGQMDKLSLELNFYNTSFIWPLICILVYKHTYLQQALTHVFIHLSSRCLWTSRSFFTLCRKTLSISPFFHSLMDLVTLNMFKN